MTHDRLMNYKRIAPFSNRATDFVMMFHNPMILTPPAGISLTHEFLNLVTLSPASSDVAKTRSN